MLASKRPALGESVCLLVILSLCVSNAIKTRGAELAVGQPNKTADLTKLISETLAINNKTSPSTGASRDDWTFDRVEYDLMEFLQDLSARYKQQKPSEAQDQELLDARREWTETVNEIKQALNITGDDLGPKKSSNEKPAQSSTPSPTNSDTTTAAPAAKITAATPPALGTSLASGDHDLSESSWQYGIFDRFTRPRSTSTLAPPDVNMDRVNVRDFNSDECGLRTYEVEQNTFYPQSPMTAAEAIKELNQRRQRPVQIPLAGQKKYQFDSAADFGITDYDKRLFNEEASKINDERQSSSIDDNTNWDSEFNLSSRRQWLQQQLGHTLQLLGFNGTTSSMSEFLNQTSGESMNTRENMMKMSGKLGKSLPTGSQAPVDATASVDQLKARQDELKLEARVIGGTDARLGDSPWSVSLQALVSRPGTGAVEYRHYCGGSIISEYYILTAAHCLDFMVGRESRLFVVVGDLNWRMSAASMYGRRFGIDKLIIHSGYKSTAFGHDIGLIRTKESMKPLKVNGRYIVNSVCLPEKGVEHTGEAELVGWGLFSNRNEMADSLQIADVPILPRPLCVDLYRRRTGLIQWLIGIELITDKQVCAGTFGRGICQGDSGSALVFNEKVPRVGVMRKTRQISKILRNHLAEREQQSRATIIGIVAFGGIRRCSYQSLPGVYMQTSKYMDWILPRIHA